MLAALSVYLFSEVFVIGYEDPVLFKCFLKDVIVIGAAVFIIDGKDLVFLFTQPTRNCRTCTFIDKKPHLHWLHCQRHEACILQGSGCEK